MQKGLVRNINGSIKPDIIIEKKEKGKSTKRAK